MKKHLSAEDLILWQFIKDTVQPLKSRPLVLQDPLRQILSARPASHSSRKRVEGQQNPSSALPVPAKNWEVKQPKTTYYLVRIDSRLLKKIKPEAVIDLHGYTLLQAEEALRAFIVRSQNLGQRWVLVITGKGRKDSAFGEQTIRIQTQNWLSANLSLVLSFTEAPSHQGGKGAFYVNLRRKK